MYDFSFTDFISDLLLIFIIIFGYTFMIKYPFKLFLKDIRDYKKPYPMYSKRTFKKKFILDGTVFIVFCTSYLFLVLFLLNV